MEMYGEGDEWKRDTRVCKCYEHAIYLQEVVCLFLPVRAHLDPNDCNPDR